MLSLIAQSDANPFGKIEAPAAVQESYGVLGQGAGLTGLVSNLIILITVVGGIWALFNILMAGFMVITSEGDAKKLSEMSSKISGTVIGLLVMIAAPLLAALIGVFFFGDPMYFLNPEITGPGTL